MADDPFYAELDHLFAEAPAFDDAAAFAEEVERRLQPSPARPALARPVLLGLAALAGAGLSLQSLQAGWTQGRPALEQAGEAAARWSLALSELASALSIGSGGSGLWIFAGVAAAVAASLVMLQEI